MRQHMPLTYPVFRDDDEYYSDFKCAICGKFSPLTETDDDWSVSATSVCAPCAKHWGNSIKGFRGSANRDRLAMRRLSAVITRLRWEITNGTR